MDGVFQGAGPQGEGARLQAHVSRSCGVHARIACVCVFSCTSRRAGGVLLCYTLLSRAPACASTSVSRCGVPSLSAVVLKYDQSLGLGAACACSRPTYRTRYLGVVDFNTRPHRSGVAVPVPNFVRVLFLVLFWSCVQVGGHGGQGEERDRQRPAAFFPRGGRLFCLPRSACAHAKKYAYAPRVGYRTRPHLRTWQFRN